MLKLDQALMRVKKVFKKMWIHFLSFHIICLAVQMISVNGHARLMEPPARNTMWRFGFSTLPNYEDSEMFCGGLKVFTF